MARTNIAVQAPGALLGGSPSAGALTLTWTAADTSNNNMADLTGKEVLLAWNTHASTGYTVTVTSVVDRNGRTGDITSYALAAGEIACIGPIQTEGFQQTGTDKGKIYFQANNAAVKFAVVQFNGAGFIYR